MNILGHIVSFFFNLFHHAPSTQTTILPTPTAFITPIPTHATQLIPQADATLKQLPATGISPLVWVFLAILLIGGVIFFRRSAKVFSS